MRLGLVLLHLSKTKMPYRFRGKYRKVVKPTLDDLRKMKDDFQREEQNMLILRHPYLTIEQSNGHMSETGRTAKFFEKKIEERNQKFQKVTTIADRLCHLRVTEAWD